MQVQRSILSNQCIIRQSVWVGRFGIGRYGRIGMGWTGVTTLRKAVFNLCHLTNFLTIPTIFSTKIVSGDPKPRGTPNEFRCLFALQHAESGRDRQMRPDFDGVKRTSADFALEPAELGITDSRNHDPERSCSRLGTLARLRRKIKKNQRRTIIYNYHYIISELQQPMATELLVT